MSQDILTYRAYHVTPDGHITSVEFVHAASDQEALALARALTKDHDIEVWDRARMVGSVEPSEPAVRRA